MVHDKRDGFVDRHRRSTAEIAWEEISKVLESFFCALVSRCSLTGEKEVLNGRTVKFGGWAHGGPNLDRAAILRRREARSDQEISSGEEICR